MARLARHISNVSLSHVKKQAAFLTGPAEAWSHGDRV